MKGIFASDSVSIVCSNAFNDRRWVTRDRPSVSLLPSQRWSNCQALPIKLLQRVIEIVARRAGRVDQPAILSLRRPSFTKGRAIRTKKLLGSKYSNTVACCNHYSRTVKKGRRGIMDIFLLENWHRVSRIFILRESWAYRRQGLPGVTADA
jgi:hypothetical protein